MKDMGSDLTLAKMDAAVTKVTNDLKLAPPEIAAIRQALAPLQNATIAPAVSPSIAALPAVDAALEALGHKQLAPSVQTGRISEAVTRLRGEIETLGGNVTWSKMDAEVTQLTDHLKLAPAEVAELRTAIAPLQSLTIAPKLVAPSADPLSAVHSALENLSRKQLTPTLLAPTLQTGGITSAVAQIRASIQSMGSELTWAKVDAEVNKLTNDLKLAPPEVSAIRNALAPLENVKRPWTCPASTPRLKPWLIRISLRLCGLPG
jgi:hypothetical protein